MTALAIAQVTPWPRETLASLFDRLSAALHAPLGQLHEAVGLGPDYPRGYGVLLHPTLVPDVADALSLEPDAVECCTLTDLRRTVREPRLQDWANLGVWASRQAVTLAGTRYCPACLRSTRAYRLEWRLPEVIGCPQHDVLLVETCADCGRAPHSGPRLGTAPSFLSYIREPGRCFNQPHPDKRGHGCAAPPCGADLTLASPEHASTLETAYLLRVQRLHGGHPVVLAGQLRGGHEARRALREAFAVQRLLDRVSGRVAAVPRARTYKTPGSVRETADLLPGLWPWLSQDSPDQAAAELAAAMRLPGWSPTLGALLSVLPPRPVLGPVLSSALRWHGRPSLRANRIRTDGAVAAPGYLSRLPQRCWSCALPEQPRGTRLPHQAYQQVAMSMLLARRFTTTWREAAELLRLPPEAVRWTRNVHTALGRAGLTEPWMQRSEHLHRQLDGHEADWTTSHAPAVLTLPSLQEGRCAEGTDAWCPCASAPSRTGSDV